MLWQLLHFLLVEVRPQISLFVDVNADCGHKISTWLLRKGPQSTQQMLALCVSINLMSSFICESVPFVMIQSVFPLLITHCQSEDSEAWAFAHSHRRGQAEVKEFPQMTCMSLGSGLCRLSMHPAGEQNRGPGSEG